MLAGMTSETLYRELSRLVPAGVDRDRDRTEYTFDDRETVDKDRATEARRTRLLDPDAPTLGRDFGRTEHTATVETIDRDRHVLNRTSALVGGDLYDALSFEAGEGPDRGRTESTKAGIETIDNDRHAQFSSTALLAGEDLYHELARVVSGVGDPGRTELTEATETIDWDKPPGALLT